MPEIYTRRVRIVAAVPLGLLLAILLVAAGLSSLNAWLATTLPVVAPVSV